MEAACRFATRTFFPTAIRHLENPMPPSSAKRDAVDASMHPRRKLAAPASGQNVPHSPPEIPNVPNPQPEIQPSRQPEPELPQPPADPSIPPAPGSPEITPPPSAPEVPPPLPEQV
jgi:hypothetical protein